MNRLLSLHLMFVFSGINCNNDGSDGETDGWKYTSKLKEPISTPEDFFTLVDGKDTPQKLIRLLFDAEYRESKNIALRTKTPDEFMSRMLDDDVTGRIYDVPMTKIHMHHLFPPHLVRPLQRVVVEKLIDIIRDDPIKKFKRKVKKVKTLGTVAVGLGILHKELQEHKSHKTTAQYRVSGLVDLSSKRHKTYNKDDYLERYKRSDDEMVEAVKDFKLVGPKSEPESGKHYWPFHESKEEIYEKWNKFPVYKDPDPFHEKVRYLHRSFHELHPELLHIVKDVHGLIGHTTKTKIIADGPDLESPLVLLGQFIKLADSLIPSIRIRIPFIEYLVKSFYEKSKPKVVYVKQPPKIQYVGLPYEEPYPKPEPLQINVPITVPVVEPVVVPERVPYPTTDKDSGQYRRLMTEENGSESGSRNYEVITNFQLNDPSPQQQQTHISPISTNSGSQFPNAQHRYTQMFEEAVQMYQDKEKPTES